MVYKIEGEFNNETFAEIITKLEKNFVFIYKNNSLYLAIRRIDSVEDVASLDKKLRTTLNKYKDTKDKTNLYSIIKMSEHNLSGQEPDIIQWCRDNFVRLEAQLYQIKEQDSLHRVWESMDRMEEELKVKLEESIKEETKEE